MSDPNKARFIVVNREARADNSSFVLNIDGSVPGRIWAFIDADLLREMNAQFAKRAYTGDVVPSQGEGHAIEYVSFYASLREILTNKDINHFDCDDEIDRWVEELESLAQYLRDFKLSRS
jgi:hypothetical protein